MGDRSRHTNDGGESMKYLITAIFLMIGMSAAAGGLYLSQLDGTSVKYEAADKP